MNGDLTTLANVKGWLGITVTTDDALLTRLITAQSRFIQSWLNRRIASQQYTEARDGLGAGRGSYVMMFNDFPVSSVSSLMIGTFNIPLSPDGAILQPGYAFDANQLWLSPANVTSNRFDSSVYSFTKGIRNVVVKYVAGFLVMPWNAFVPGDPDLLPSEVQTIPATPYQITPQLTWLQDNGVWNNTTGVAFTKVASGPIAGQYSVDATGLYTFAAADSGTMVALSYSYVPGDIEQACIELIGLRYKEKDRIGQVSKHVGTETISYSQKDMPSDVATMLNQRRKVFAFA
jgi:Phage gp6-like head-tail connector protein